MVLPCIVLGRFDRLAGNIRNVTRHPLLLMPLLKVAWYMACYGRRLVCIVTFMTVMTVVTVMTFMIVMTVVTVMTEAKSCQLPKVSLCVACLSKLTLYCHQ